jgi:hypothetical protein
MLEQLFSSTATSRLGDPWVFLGPAGQAQANYSAFDRELYAVVATIRHFHFMLGGRCFVVFTDNKPLLGAISRWSDGVCLTYLRLDTSTKCLKLFYTSLQPILG